MPQPTQYTPTTDFSQQEANNASGRSTVNTAALDTEFANIEQTLGGVRSNLALIQRDDGRLADLTVEARTLSQDVLNLIGGFVPRGLWSAATAYALNDICSNDAYTYICKTAHTSGVTFDAQYWTQFGFTSGADAAQAAAAAQASAVSAENNKNITTSLATSASNSASASSNSASSASGSATIAATKAGEASVSATAAGNAAAAAASSAASSAAAASSVLASLALPTGASLIGFKQDGTGPVSATVNRKLREVVSVQDFGAVGSGVADDTTAFSNATAVGAPVFVPYTSQFYKLTALTAGQRALLWGPGIVKVGGAITPISSAPTFASADLAGSIVVKPALSPAQWPGIIGSLGNGASNYDVTRIGGYGTYGSVLSRLIVTAPVVANEFDVATTAWVTTTNLTQVGAAVFGSWFGANTPSKNLGQTYTGGFAVGQEINVGNRWADFGLQLDIDGTRWTAGQTLAPDVLPSSDGVDAVSVPSITIAAPGVVTINNHGFIANQGVVFNGAGTLPTGLAKGQVYYVSSAGLTTNTFQVCSTPGGAPINTTGSFSAPITATPSWAGSFGQVIARSIWGHRWWVGTLIRYDSIVATGHAHYECGGSVAEMAPASWAKLAGYWQNGIDLSAAICSGAAINFSYSNSNAVTATAGSVASPGNFQGFIKVAMSGTIIKIPYFQN